MRLATPENIRNAPSRARDGSSGRAPAVPASDTASEYRTPDRAVLLGKAGAITASTRNRLYESPSVDRPKACTTAWPIRSPRPHLTTARATRNAAMIRTMVPLANPDHAAVGRDDASEDRDGNREQGRGQDRQGPDTTEKMAAGEEREEVPRRER